MVTEKKLTEKDLYNASNWQRVTVGDKEGKPHPTFRVSVEGQTAGAVDRLKKGLEREGLRSKERLASFDTGTIRKGEKTLRISPTCFEETIVPKAMYYTHNGTNGDYCEYLAFSEILRKIDQDNTKAVQQIVNNTRGR